MGVIPANLLDSALTGNRRDLARMLTVIENGGAFDIPEQSPWTLGVTGPPGVGKSTLIGRLISNWADMGRESPSSLSIRLLRAAVERC